jgi:hypothetical protein
MDVPRSTLRLDDSYREDGTLTSVMLPAGAASGGLLLDESGRRLLVLFADEELEPGDEVRVPSGSRFTVTSVQHGRLNGEPVTALQVRPGRPGDEG